MGLGAFFQSLIHFWECLRAGRSHFGAIPIAAPNSNHGDLSFSGME